MLAVPAAFSVPVLTALWSLSPAVRGLGGLARGHLHTHLSSTGTASGFSSDLGRTNSGCGLALGTEGDGQGDKLAWPTVASEGSMDGVSLPLDGPRGCRDPPGVTDGRGGHGEGGESGGLTGEERP